MLLVNLGTPEAPTAAALRPYLRQFLSDPGWWRFRADLVADPQRDHPHHQAAKVGGEVRDGVDHEGSPLKFHTERQAKLLKGYLGMQGHGIDGRVRDALRRTVDS